MSTDNSFKEIFPHSNACVFQWNYPIINLGRNEYRNCCRTGPSSRLNEADLKKHGSQLILNSPDEREKRARMLLGEKISSCSSCWRLEEKNMLSPRVDHSFFPHELEESADDILKLKAAKTIDEKVKILSNSSLTYSKKVNMLEISLKNTCDMQCMYCSHHYSSKWATDKIKRREILPYQMSFELPKAHPEFKEQLTKWFKEEGAHTVNYINFIGGEPTLIEDYYELSLLYGEVLAKLERKHVTISVVTNLNCTPKVMEKFCQHLVKLSEYFSYVDINVSMEAFGTRAEYIRKELNWDRWMRNLETLLKLPIKNGCVSAQMATNILSISTLPDLLKLYGDLATKYSFPIHLRQNVVTDPAAHSPMLLTSDFSIYLEKAIDIINEYGAFADSLAISESEKNYRSWHKYQIFLNQLKSTIDGRQHLSRSEKKIISSFFNRHDNRQAQSIYTVFPEYSEFFAACSVKNSQLRRDIIKKIKNIFN